MVDNNQPAVIQTGISAHTQPAQPTPLEGVSNPPNGGQVSDVGDDFVSNPNYKQPSPSGSDSDFVDNPSFQQPDTDEGGVLGTLKGIGTGISKEAAKTADSALGLAEKIPGFSALEHFGSSPETQANRKLSSQDLQGTAEHVGAGAETIGEFILGDEALKGLSVADRMLKASKVMKYLESFPRVAQALRLGINVGKAGAELGPEERALIQKSPILARLVGAGMDAIRQGTTQGVQSLVKSGNADPTTPGGQENWKNAAESGLEMAGTSGLLGGATGALGGALDHAGQAAKTTEELATAAKDAPTATEANTALGTAANDAVKPTIDEAQAAKGAAEEKLAGASSVLEGAKDTAPTKEAIVNKAQAHAKAGEQALNDAYEKTANELRTDPDLENVTIEGKGSAFQEKANDALFGKNADDDIRKTLGARIPASPDIMAKVGKLAGPGGQLEKDAAGNARELNFSQLMDYAKDVKEQLRNVGYSTPQDMRDRQVYYDLLDGIHQSMDDLVSKAGKPQLMDKLLKMNQAYREGIKTFENPDVKALLKGSNENGIINILSGGKSAGDIRAIRKAIGDNAFSQLIDDGMSRIAADAKDPITGKFDISKWIKSMANIPDDVRGEMVNGSRKGGAFENIFNQVRDIHANDAIGHSEQTIKTSEDLVKSILGNEPDFNKILKQPEKVQQLAKLVGPEAMGALGDTLMKTQLREAATNAKGAVGNVDTGKVLDFVASLKDSPETVDAFFKPTPERAAAYDKLIADMQHTQAVKNLIKVGIVVPSVGGAGLATGIVSHSVLAGVVGTMLAGGGEAVGKQFIEKLANSPRTWAALKALNNGAQSSVAQTAARIGKAAAGKGVISGTDSLKNIYNNTQTQLSNQ